VTARAPRWTLAELADQVSAQLGSAPVQASGRVRDIPDARAIRYYTTLGLLDRPAAMQGRTALYGLRHLRQLVAIKKLQARGATLAEIQGELAGIGDAALARLAGLTDTPSTDAAPRPAPTREAFWRRRPAPPPPPQVLQGVTVGPVQILVPAARVIEAADLERITTAAEPLLRELEALGLTRKDPVT
jgi:hypothetical protein